MAPEEFLNRMVETLGIIIDRRPKEDLENGKLNHRKNRMCCPVSIIPNQPRGQGRKKLLIND